MPCLPTMRLTLNRKARHGRGKCHHHPLKRPKHGPDPPFLYSPHLHKRYTMSLALVHAPLAPLAAAGPHPALPPPPAHPKPAAPQIKLLDLPEDVLVQVMRHLTRPGGAGAAEADGLRAARPAAQACRALNSALHLALDRVTLYSAALRDADVVALARRGGPSLRHLVVRSCAQLTDAAVLGVAAAATRLRAVDLSFLPGVTDDAVAALCRAARASLRKVLLRKCVGLGDRAVSAIALCASVEVVDISYVARVTDVAVARLARGCGASLRLLSVSHCSQLTDDTFGALGRHCAGLEQLCARGLPLLTDRGFERLCRGVGRSVAGIDVLDCVSLTRDPVLRTLRRFCPRVMANMLRDVGGNTLRQIIVTTLRSNIFIVHGCDPTSGRDTIHMVLVDNGDIGSANILSAGTTDLSLLGVVLCKSYGNSLDDETKDMLSRNYGILPSMLAE